MNRMFRGGRLAVRRSFAAATWAALLACCFSSPASAEFWINEIYFDPPGSAGDLVYEYVELRGTPGASLADMYLIFLENENSDTANPGLVEFIFDLGALSPPTMGSNGFLLLRQAGNVYSNVAPGTADFVNTGTAFGWGSGPTSTVGATVEGGNGRIENSGFTAMLLKNLGDAGNAPVLGLDLDADDDAMLDVATGRPDWVIYDSVGVNSESGEEDGFLYAPINFGVSTPAGGPNIPPGAIYVETGFEIEYVGRWGDSTGSTEKDWHASNLTNDSRAGYTGPADLRQAGEPHGFGAVGQFVETSQGVPYGMNLVDTLGSSNLFIQDGDFVIDGLVDGSDFLRWQRNYGFGSGQYATREHGDADLDGTVGDGDLVLWAVNYGYGYDSAAAAAATQAVPEPTTAVLALLAFAGLARRRF
ncbi:MAG: hypothetical protein KF688_02600 [Pirellulales bacterium]|nr:hypothetical protein [Pirellulales bacterium]